MNISNTLVMDIIEILKYFLPITIIDNFDLVKIDEFLNDNGKEMHLFFDEKYQHPESYPENSLESKGFHKAFHINDFPIQNKKVKLCIRKRRWIDKQTNKIFSKSYDFKHKGTSYSKGLACFLKGGVR
jgi:transposase